MRFLLTEIVLSLSYSHMYMFSPCYACMNTLNFEIAVIYFSILPIEVYMMAACIFIHL